jgi:hypothetical protein
VTAPALTFLAPPSSQDDPGTSAETARGSATLPAGPATRRKPSPGRSAGALRMTRGAREAAAGMKVADDDIQKCLDAPDDVFPDENAPSRTRFRRGALVVLAGGDGMVLRVDRRRR